MTIACVLRSGGEYKPEHVEALAHAVKDHGPLTCLTDVPDQIPNWIDTIPMIHHWPGWWSKLELLRPGLFNDRVLFFDLDTVICGSIDPLFMTFGTVMLRDFFLDTPSSAIMAWDPDELAHVYEAFLACPDPMDERHKVNPKQNVYGDQSWIEKCLVGHDLAYFQDLLPGRIHLWHQCQSRKPPNASVICFAGAKRPWNQRGWARAYYQG